jgi:hypothetical protein
MDHNNIQGEVAGSGRVGSTTLFAGVAVATERWLVISFEVRTNMKDVYRLQG